MTPDARLAVDTNVLIYAEGHGDDDRCRRANDLMQRLTGTRVVLPVQVCGELYRVLRGKYRLPAARAAEVVARWADLHGATDSTWTAMQSAIDAAATHQLAIWDALILAVAAEQRCSLLLSEDLQHGCVWRGVTVVDPFATPPHPLLASLLPR